MKIRKNRDKKAAEFVLRGFPLNFSIDLPPVPGTTNNSHSSHQKPNGKRVHPTHVITSFFLNLTIFKANKLIFYDVLIKIIHCKLWIPFKKKLNF